MLSYIIRFLPILIFVALLILFFIIRRNKIKKSLYLRRWIYSIIIIIAVFCSTLVFLRFFNFAETPGGNYIPPRYTDEGIVPGHVER